MSGALLEVNGISVSFDGFKAINSLSFNIDNCELRAIIGPNGAGKTTFMDIITGKTRPDSGDVIWGEKNVSLIKKSFEAGVMINGEMNHKGSAAHEAAITVTPAM